MSKIAVDAVPAPSVSTPVKRKRGRPSIRLDASLAKRIVALASEGKSAREISEDIGVSVTTLNNWKGAKESMRAAIEASRRVADELVVSALFRRAVGYSHPAVKMFYDKERGIVTEHYTEHYPPDTTACMFWLKNRQRMLWQDTHELAGTFNATIQTGEIEALASRLETILRDTHGSMGHAMAAGNAATGTIQTVDPRDGAEADTSHGAALSTQPTEGLFTNEV